jgi:hypothetical protein
MATPAFGPGSFQLPKKECHAPAERQWLSVADAAMPVAESHKVVRKKRLSEYKAGRAKAVPHAELMKRVWSL